MHAMVSQVLAGVQGCSSYSLWCPVEASKAVGKGLLAGVAPAVATAAAATPSVVQCSVAWAL